MNWPTDKRPLWERALETRQLEAERTHPVVHPRMASIFQKVTSFTRIGNGAYLRLECGHVVRRKQITAVTSCRECRAAVIAEALKQRSTWKRAL